MNQSPWIWKIWIGECGVGFVGMNIWTQDSPIFQIFNTKTSKFCLRIKSRGKFYWTCVKKKRWANFKKSAVWNNNSSCLIWRSDWTHERTIVNFTIVWKCNTSEFFAFKHDFTRCVENSSSINANKTKRTIPIAGCNNIIDVTCIFANQDAIFTK